MTIAVLTVVEGTPKSSTMPPIDTGSAATLKDMRIWAGNSPTIGTQDAFSCGATAVPSVLVMGLLVGRACGGGGRGGGARGCGGEDVEPQ